MQRKALVLATAMALAVVMLGSSFVEAQAIGSVYPRRPTGISVSVVGSDPVALSADIEVQVNTQTGSYITSSTYTGTYPTGTYLYYYGPFQFGMLGSQARSWSGWGYATVLNPDMNAVEWGDGAGTIDGTTIPMVMGTPGSFRGAFSHTYPTTGIYNVQALTTSFWLGTATPSNPNLTQVTNGQPFLIPPGANFTTYATYWGATYTWTAPSQTTSYAPITASYAIGLFDVASVMLQQPVEPIPTLSAIAIFALAVMLAAVGVFVLARRG